MTDALFTGTHCAGKELGTEAEVSDKGPLILPKQRLQA